MISVLLSVATKIWRLAVAFAASVGSWASHLLKSWRYRADVHKLQGMSDRQLSDIGLTRPRIDEAVRGGAHRKSEPLGRLSTLFHP